jgi:hypothetical protein
MRKAPQGTGDEKAGPKGHGMGEGEKETGKGDAAAGDSPWESLVSNRGKPIAISLQISNFCSRREKTPSFVLCASACACTTW